MCRRTVELDDAQAPGSRAVGHHARRGAPPAERQKALRMVELDDALPTRQRGLGTGKIEASLLAYQAAGAVAADQECRIELTQPCGASQLDPNTRAGVFERLYRLATPNFDAEAARVLGQDALERRLRDAPHSALGLALQRLVDQEETAKIASDRAGRRRLARCVEGLRHVLHRLQGDGFFRVERVAETAPLERLRGERTDAAGLERLIRLGAPLDHYGSHAAEHEL